MSRQNYSSSIYICNNFLFSSALVLMTIAQLLVVGTPMTVDAQPANALYWIRNLPESAVAQLNSISPHDEVSKPFFNRLHSKRAFDRLDTSIFNFDAMKNVKRFEDTDNYWPSYVNEVDEGSWVQTPRIEKRVFDRLDSSNFFSGVQKRAFDRLDTSAFFHNKRSLSAPRSYHKNSNDFDTGLMQISHYLNGDHRNA